MVIFGFQINFWTVWGFAAQFLFLLSFIIQWYKSEKIGRSHLPAEFWRLRLIASVMILCYALQRKDLVFIIGATLQIGMYSRNIYLNLKNKRHET